MQGVFITIIRTSPHYDILHLSQVFNVCVTNLLPFPLRYSTCLCEPSFTRVIRVFCQGF